MRHEVSTLLATALVLSSSAAALSGPLAGAPDPFFGTSHDWPIAPAPQAEVMQIQPVEEQARSFVSTGMVFFNSPDHGSGAGVIFKVGTKFDLAKNLHVSIELEVGKGDFLTIPSDVEDAVPILESY